MSVLNENISIKIRDVQYMQWDVSSVRVAARPYHALVFRISGRASFSHENTTVSTDVGDVFYMPADYEYYAEYREKNEILVIHFESDLISQMENYHLKNSRNISLLFYKLYDIWDEKEDGYYYSALAVMCEIIKNISSQQTPCYKSKTAEAFENAVDYMENNYTSGEFSVKEMIAQSYMSNTYFRRLFIDKFGVTPAKYVVSKRLIYAEKLLSSGVYTIKEAAEMSGFCDVKYFSRVVKKEYGVPPSHLYRHINN